jgi:hypothetical protein
MTEFIEKLIAFKNAAYGLLTIWEKLDHTGDYYAGKYPFDKSYDEVCNDISTWLEAQEEEENGRDKGNVVV